MRTTANNSIQRLTYPACDNVRKVQAVICGVSKLCRLAPLSPEAMKNTRRSLSRWIEIANYSALNDGASNSVPRTDLRASHFIAGRVSSLLSTAHFFGAEAGMTYFHNLSSPIIRPRER